MPCEGLEWQRARIQRATFENMGTQGRAGLKAREITIDLRWRDFTKLQMAFSRSPKSNHKMFECEGSLIFIF